MPRLFTALALPEAVRTQLTFLRGGLKGARWIDPANYHITLRFIGDVDDRVADEIAYTLSSIQRDPLSIRLCGLASFGSRKPHSVYARVEPTEALSELQAEQERMFQRLGLPAEARRFTPHVTIARLRGTSPREVADWLTVRGGFAVPPFEVEEFALLSSRASTGGGPYLTEELYPLEAVPA
ncbi:RNA 2',3'-cyclic phosphodiesterase [Acuticoccus sp. MNP-M23]|uniref:RNA 2',3'-cyclic phosphodiesterase n=1 Tax=Acuticoccus sp. MNP-M23 TaxID=3072793 RepID=UPI002815B8C9|nr:RNA 2',3'-cyclic phosphodiesterase [Acuticoccus sp. MNP-M23]WMS41075.1 RNA 2',3'-cyclic phosphodiesterase [Acuticoccus sp. MNP-M23]